MNNTNVKYLVKTQKRCETVLVRFQRLCKAFTPIQANSPHPIQVRTLMPVIPE